jgi:uncharacterized protein YecT (DUF1311 family)
MLNISWITKLYFLLLMIGSPCFAAVFETKKITNDLTLISVSGPIEYGDSKAFMLLSISTKNVIVSLNSPGGLVGEGLLIAEQIFQYRYDTYVADSSECASMCGIIWLSGARRFLSENARVGFHGAYVESIDGIFSISGPGNAKIGAFLGKIGVANTAIGFITNSQPDDLAYVGFNEAKSLGFLPETLNENFNDKVSEPLSPLASVKIAVYLMLYESKCLEMMETPPANLDRYYASFYDIALRGLGEDAFKFELHHWYLNVTGRLEREGNLSACLEAEKIIRAAGVPTGFWGPSFDCLKYQSDAHQALCKYPSLWAADTVMNSIYWNIRENSGLVNDIQAFIGRQKQWITMRDGCKSSIKCLENQYSVRLEEIMDELRY